MTLEFALLALEAIEHDFRAMIASGRLNFLLETVSGGTRGKIK